MRRHARTPPQIGGEIAGFEAECHRRQGDGGKALAILEAALRLHPRSYWLHHNIASVYREAGRKAECAQEYRRAHVEVGWTESEANRYIFLHDYFSPVIPCWTKWFGEIIVAEPIAALEIGSWQGGSATWLLDKIVAPRGGRLTCIDTFEGSSEHASWIGGIGDRIGDLFDANIAASGHAALCRKLVGRSQEVLRTLHLERFDFIYIDGAHEARYVIEDAVLAFGLLKDGGYICFDDYDFQFAANPGQNTARAIDMFLDLYQAEISFVEKGRQVYCVKATVSPRGRCPRSNRWNSRTNRRRTIPRRHQRNRMGFVLRYRNRWRLPNLHRRARRGRRAERDLPSRRSSRGR